MLSNIIDRIRLPFRKDKELYLSLRQIIGFYPHDISYYKLALMHKSMYNRHFPGKREGFLTNTRSKLVQRETLNRLAQELGINQLILSSGRSQSHNSYMGGNAFEALVGAIYLDRGYDACMQFMRNRILAQMINIDKVAYKEVNFKSKLIEWSQKNRVRIDFKVLSQEKDKTGSPVFSYQVMLEGVEGCSGKGYSKKESQQLASKLTLEKLRKEPQFIDQVFAAKTERTKMEEEPVENVPSTEENNDFIIANPEVEANAEAAVQTLERQKSKRDRRAPMYRQTEKAQPVADKEESDAEEFDLSDISAKEKSREDIIAAAEAAAFAE